MFRKKCLVCNSEKVIDIIDLGIHPFADTFVPESRYWEADQAYPLVCQLCENCGHVQTKCKTDPKARYSQIDYSYTSSNSSFSRKHWERYERDISKDVDLLPGSFVVEIGSNDGYLSELFLKNGMKVLGVDPSPYMTKLANERNVETLTQLFGKTSSQEILNSHGKADLVIANNVFNHSNTPVEFAETVMEILKPKGFFVFEQPYWLTSLKSKKFDQIYHEHVSYFTVKSLSRLLDKAELAIKFAKVVDYHGGSLRIVAQRKENLDKSSDEADKMVKVEEDYGTFLPKTYEKLMKEIIENKNKFVHKVYEIKRQGHPIIAVGGAAKGNTLLNFYNLGKGTIDYVTDSSPHKQGKYTPLTRIPIVGDEIFSKYNEPYALILSWNIVDQLKESLEKINPNIKFISPEES